jgi:hypothetical protein
MKGKGVWEKHMIKQPFLLVVTDRDRGVFTIEGPMSDDTQWNSAVVAAQEAGRQINCHTPGPGTKEQVAHSVASELGLTQVQSGSIVHPGAL